MNEPFEDEPLLEGHGAIPAEAFTSVSAPGDLRDAIWHETTVHVRRRRLMSLAKRCAAAAALFVCGIGVGVVATGPRSGPIIPHSNDIKPQTASPAAGGVADTLLLDSEVFALKLETATKPEQVVLLRRAGDQYLNELGDVQLALRCYQRMLELEDPREAAAVDTDDTWLLMALKSDRQRETDHDQPSA